MSKMKPLKPDQWKPVNSMSLEENAIEVATKTENYLVVAGPGAGKTELLAQKASFLLQTNICRFPQRILAISFKRDAAYNLKERVRLRCGDELTKRFDSFTFDSFAKQLLDRFKQALPVGYKITEDYDVVLSDNAILDFYRSEDIDYFNTTDRDFIFALHGSQLPHSQSSKEDQIRNRVWKKMLQGKSSTLSFRMIMRLAEYMINSNPKVKQYLQLTYHFVFLDEFQDTTEIQYDFFKSCFLQSSSAFTAVGDDKQRIMLWAGAQNTIFEDFIVDTSAKRIPLTMNFRSAPRLVALLNHLTQHLLGKSDFAIPSPKWKPNQGECFVWVFDKPSDEIQLLFTEVQKWMATDTLNPRDVCILVKQQLSKYAGDLINYFNENGIKARDENRLQDLLTQDISIFLTNVLYSVFQKSAGDARRMAFTFLSNLNGEADDEQLLRIEASYSRFLHKIKSSYNGVSLTDDTIKNMFSEIISFAGKDRIRAHFPSYKNISALDKVVSEFLHEFISSYNVVKDVVPALDNIVGKDTIPVMTIHKSKGLEYHTVIFIGLEDGAFWSFEKQPDEDKCAFFVALSRAKERVVFTFSKEREGRFGIEKQTTKKIKVILDELQKSGVVEMIEQKP
jgi:DNA helicase II / ATP-dependent DNA helicase PcrA